MRFLDDRRIVSHHVNDLYRRVVNRNNRQKKLVEIGAPEAVLDHEKRLLQQAVDALIDNRGCPAPVLDRQGRPVPSLADIVGSRQ